MFDPRSRAAYSVAVFVIAATMVLFKAAGFSLDPSVMVPWPLLTLFVAGPLARRISWPKLAGTLECFGFLYGQAIFLFALLPLTVISGPLTDDRLAAWDRALGFDWVAFVTWARPAIPALTLAYDSFALQALFIVSALFYVGQATRAWRLTSAALVAVLICSIVYIFFPAESAMMHYRVYTTNAHEGVVSGPVIRAVKDGARVVTWDLLKGLITFPSYHACAAALFAWAAWPIRSARWLFVILNLTMIVACVVVGSHYFVDVLGGIAVAVISLLLVRGLGLNNDNRRVITAGAGRVCVANHG
jgi:membrane-associated phospholipid phosphatase